MRLNTSGQATVNAADVNNGSSDNCAVTGYKIAKGTVTAGDASFAASVTFGCGETGPQTVTLQVQDAANNKATCQATVTVSDTTNPTATCQNIAVSLNASGQVTVNAADVNNGSSDNCAVTGYKVAKGTVTAGAARRAVAVACGCGGTGPQSVT